MHRDRVTTHSQALREWVSDLQRLARVTTRSRAHREWASARPPATFLAHRHPVRVHLVQALRVRLVPDSVLADSSAQVGLAPQVAASSVRVLRPVAASSAPVALLELPARTSARTVQQAAAVVVADQAVERQVHSVAVAARASPVSRSGPRGRNSNSGKPRRLVA
ncbi:hypothetical protein GCM10011313_26720 [Mycetocola zhadangensis]|nr:hypothetical protein GCM10011313_26720 [Mycetocola zhadangensis]